MPRSNDKLHEVFAGLPTLGQGLPDARKAEIKADYGARRFGLIFPAGSAGIPPLLVGRKPQMVRLSALATELLDAGSSAPRSLVGVALHGPRGTGKTALLAAFSNGVQSAGGFVIDMTGNNALRSEARLIGRLANLLPPEPEETETSRQEGSGGFRVGISGGYNVGSERRTTRPGGWRPFADVEDVLRAVLERGADKAAPLLLAIDEAHVANSAALGALLNSVQNLSRKGVGLPVAIVMAGTPDLIDVLRSANVSWFLDRARSDRLAPMPNDLSPADCAAAIGSVFDAAGVGVRDDGSLLAAAKACRGSPYFLQALGKAALESASRNGDIADFTPGGEIAATFQSAVEERYDEAWNDLDGQGLTGCARQLGALWRAKGHGPNPITERQVVRAIESGLEHAPPPVRSGQPLPSPEEAESHFKHLGLLWSETGLSDGPWSLGLPSFFDHVEALFHNAGHNEHHAALPALKADMDRLLGQGMT